MIKSININVCVCEWKCHKVLIPTFTSTTKVFCVLQQNLLSLVNPSPVYISLAILVNLFCWNSNFGQLICHKTFTSRLVDIIECIIQVFDNIITFPKLEFVFQFIFKKLLFIDLKWYLNLHWIFSWIYVIFFNSCPKHNRGITPKSGTSHFCFGIPFPNKWNHE